MFPLHYPPLVRAYENYLRGVNKLRFFLQIRRIFPNIATVETYRKQGKEIGPFAGGRESDQKVLGGASST